MLLTERAKQLIPLARIVGFETWHNNHNSSTIAIFEQADNEGRYLTDTELEQIKNLSPNSSDFIESARLLRDQAQEIVDYARQQVLAQYPGITENGGDLYPPERAQACWRDFWHFLRCITYGIAGQTIPFTRPEGLKNMQLLYQELQVPLGAMLCGLENLKTYSLGQFTSLEQVNLNPYFDHLIEELRNFTYVSR
ncbi:Phycobilisome protein (plasmid) [Gloeothece citriformis PCC 7424]|uniref:Phycobilisome protein n=1 Tax=Gloeothece citriformis (strain PCC 7424) TaxID=65393 RepID=B7KLW9_GLOC7|nr:phycobilisome protein [Gloeothece citriformis]ACK73791.1 Phycobilisome protein [Gloeothece citriformis PCC 7424]